MAKPPFSKEDLKKRFPMSMEIKTPAAIRDFDTAQLEALAKEYRDYLIEICSINGGHIGASLGTVELALSLHRTFESPKDKILWDIGHQAYVHKLLSGRFEDFYTLRKEGGVSGFLKRTESEHDIIGAGHCATSVSFAVGVAEGMRKKNLKNKVIAVIGDAALTSGMAYEALHQREEWKKNLIVVLNDNEMSISPNVGAVNAFLSKKVHLPFVHRFEEDMKSVLSKVPFVGDEIVETASRLKATVKSLIEPALIFESLGFRYDGPIDGHNIGLLRERLEKAKKTDQPVLIHIKTIKGLGFQPAMDDKVTFHGCGPYDRESGKLLKKPGALPSYSKIFSQTLAMLAKEDKDICAITAAMAAGTGLSSFEKELPEQFYDVGIAEQHAVTFSGGLSIEGKKPFAAIYSTFLQRGYDQVVHDICIQDLNVKFCMDRAGFAGADGETHHGIYDVTYLRTVPKMCVLAARDEKDFQELLKAMTQHIGPAAIRYPRGEGTGVSLYESVSAIPDVAWGKSDIVYFGGANYEGENTPRTIPVEWIERLVKSKKAKVDLVIAGLGPAVDWSIEAAKKLKVHGLSVLVVNTKFVKPLDQDLFRRTAELCKKVITVEEAALAGGFGSAVMEFYQSEDLLSLMTTKSLGIQDHFYHQASQEALQKQAGIDPESIYQTSLKLLATELSASAVDVARA